MDTYVVLVEDGHFDTDVAVFATERAAIAHAEATAIDGARRPGDLELDYPLNEAMTDDGWLRYIPYSSEGDCVRVMKRKLLGGQG